jgi:carbamate kinase
MLRKMCHAGEIVVAAGGGGIPVVRDRHGGFHGVEAVIDKDRTSGMLAAELGAERLVILTNVDQVQRDYRKPTARPIERTTMSEVNALLNNGQFPAGSMRPKIEASVDFLSRSKSSSAEVLITSCEHASDGIAGRTGTRITRG